MKSLMDRQESTHWSCRVVFPVLLFCFQTTVPAQAGDRLEQLFRDPPVTVRPYVWWHWMGPNFSKAGITKDLEAMKAAGIGGATIFNITSAVQESHALTLNNPWPGQTYRSPAYWEALRFAAAEADRLGLELGLHNTVGYSTTGGPWIDEARSMQHLVWSETTVNGQATGTILLPLPSLVANEGWGATGRILSFYKDIAVLAVPADRPAIANTEILDLTARFDPARGLLWEARPGSWIIYRLGHASTGKPPHPVPDDVIGRTLEADKISAEQSAYHWKAVLDPVKEHLGPYLGKSFKHMLIDSYEAGYQNWTPGFREEFRSRKGYDLLPWLVTMGPPVTGDENQEKPRRIVGNEDLTARFEWDYRDVINQLYYENGFQTGKRLLEENRLSLQFEPYGGPFDTAQGVALAGLPMGEFWTGSDGLIDPRIVPAARALGKTVVGAEAFTGWPTNSRFTEDPAYLKKSALGSYARGVNRLVLHHWVHQPFDDRYQPGMGMGWWGTHFGRNQTWFEPGKAFFKYLGRCQALLQQGEEVGDWLCVEKADPGGDLISRADFLTLNITVVNHRVTLPSGRSYPFLVFYGDRMLPAVARKVRDLVAAGTTVVSPKPDGSPSLQDYPACDREVDQIAEELWGGSSRHNYKLGTVFTSLEEARRSRPITPDYRIENAPEGDQVKVVHRRSPSADIYFVANLADKPQYLLLSFLITGKQPELWQPEDGSIMEAPVWNERDERTTVGFPLQSMQAVFVVFRKPVSKEFHPLSLTIDDSSGDWAIRPRKGRNPVLSSFGPFQMKVNYTWGEKTLKLPAPAVQELTGGWEVSFISRTDQPFSRNFPTLTDFSHHADQAVKYFAGTATYRKVFLLDTADWRDYQRLYLDLGVLNDLAEVKINGKSAGVLWYPPYRADITEFIKPGRNLLEIAVTNNWANRLIGDEQEPPDVEYGQDRGELGRALLGYPDWFIRNQPRPSAGRKTFFTWFYYRTDSPLQPAGLVGPVRLLGVVEKEIGIE